MLGGDPVAIANSLAGPARIGDTVDAQLDLIHVSSGLAAVFGRLAEVGGRPVVVGGSVRDALLGISSKDVDIECYSVIYEVLAEALADLGKVDIIGASFGVLKLWSDVDTALPRRDNKVGVGHRAFDVEVDPFLSFEAASARRDFTINAMGWDPLTGEA